MAVVVSPFSAKVQIKLENGMKEGKPVYKTKTLNNIRVDAEDQDIYDVADALASLQSKPLATIYKLEQSALDNE